MSTDDDKGLSSQRSKGVKLQVDDERLLSDSHEDASNSQRKAKVFAPEDIDTLEEPPEAITAGERLPHVSEYAGIRLEALPIKGLKKLVYSVAVLFLLVLGWDLSEMYLGLMAINSALAYGFLVFVASVLGFAGVTVWRYKNDSNNLQALEKIQMQADRLRAINDKGNAKALIAQMKAFNIGKPQALHFESCTRELPDYSNDREVVSHIERSFLKPLDEEAIRRVSNHSLSTGVAIAASPWASLDMFLSLWRSLKMIDEVAQVYGVRPSLVSRIRLLKMVLKNMALMGASEVLIDQVAEVATLGASTIIGARATQGIGASIYTARIGIAAMSVSRPFLFIEGEKPKASTLMKPVIHRVLAMEK